MLTLLAMALGPASWSGALTAGGYTFIAFLMMTSVGPLFATVVRHLRLPLRWISAGVGECGVLAPVPGDVKRTAS